MRDLDERGRVAHSERVEPYQPLPAQFDNDVVVRARIAPIPEGVYRPYSRTGEPGRVVIGQDGRIYLVDPTTVRSAEPHTWETRQPWTGDI